MSPNDPLPMGVGDPVVEGIVEKKYARKPEQPRHEDAQPPRKVAIIVNHGMGQQVPFETLELVAKALWKKELATSGQAQRILTRMVRLGTEGKPEEKELTRAEVRLTGQKPDANGRPLVGPDGQPATEVVEAHLYEAYWAPLTEGKVNLRQVISFLLDAGWTGIQNVFSGSFRRWMFGDWQSRPLRALQLILSFLGAILLVLALVIINGMIVTAATSHALGGGVGWPPASSVGLLTRDLFLVDLCAVSIFLGTIAIPWLARKLSQSKPVLYLAWFLTLAGIGGLMFMGLLIGAHLAVWPTQPLTALSAVRYVGAVAQGIAGLPPVRTVLSWGWIRFLRGLIWPLYSVEGWFGYWWIEVLLWGAAIGASCLARTVIVEYVGDVTAYIAAHTVSVFWEVRKAIYELALGVARAVYRARTPDLRDFAYSEVIVVGHSLGSVIGYDVLNGLFLEEGFSPTPLNIAERTSLFLTFGSPLDKTAFIFRTQAESSSSLREAEAATVQPMIQEYRFRPRHWKNIWSHSDWISGSLEYYDDWVRRAGGDQRVKNYRDAEAVAPLVAHTQYWHNDTFANLLYAAATRRPQPQPQVLTFAQKHFRFLYVTPGDQLS